MDKKISVILLVLLMSGAVIISGCVKQAEQAEKLSEEKPPKDPITKPNVTTEDVVSELQSIRSSMNEVRKSLSK